MSDPFIAEIRLLAFQFAPRGYAMCQGQLLSIQQNQALFSLLGTTYGGNGVQNFALPDFRGRAPLHWGTGPGQPTHVLGERSGEESHTLIPSEMPSHTHTAVGTTAAADTATAAGNFWAAGNPVYAASTNTTMHPAALQSAGNSTSHNNMQPFLALNFCIALVGTFPSRN